MKLTLEEVSQCLDLQVSTLERWIRQGRIPIQRSRDGCFFEAAALEKWASERHLPFRLPSPSGTCEADTPDESLAAAVCRGGVFHGVKGETVAEVLESAVGCIPDLTPSWRTLLLDRLLEREALSSTGVGKGVAIPHSREPIEEMGESPAIFTCFLDRPVDYRAIDDKPVFVLFLLLCPSVKTHLMILSRLAYCLKEESFVGFLKSGPSPDDFFSKIAELDRQLGPAHGPV